MRKVRAFRSAAVAGLVLASGLLAATPAIADATGGHTTAIAGSSVKNERTLYLTATATSTFINRTTPSVRTAGDTFGAYGTLSGSPAGEFSTNCTVVNIDTSVTPNTFAADCEGVLSLPDGKISFQGQLTGTSPTSLTGLPITGGTGRYKTVGGQIDVGTPSGSTACLTVHLVNLDGSRA